MEPMSAAVREHYNFELPAELVAQRPLADRSASRLLVMERGRDLYRHLHIPDLPQLLQPGDLLVFNDTRVVPARLRLRKSTGGAVEMLLERALSERTALVQIRDSKSIRLGAALKGPSGQVRVLGREGEFWEAEFPQEVLSYFEAHGTVPLPPYIRRAPDAEDRERYQSMFARDPGAVAAPTASLHFDAALLQRLAERGVRTTTVTLHVGSGTFRPLRTSRLDEHVMHEESYRVGEEAVRAIVDTRAAKGRVFAVGTTVARALESAALEARTQGDGSLLSSRAGRTQLFIRPGFEFKVVDGMLTNFHLPQSTLLIMVAAFAGWDAVLGAYNAAVNQRYRFFSYGDAMLLLPPGSAR